jgi:response regulator RpfG family c-di-GMP phosphodiesterase/signal transduction histidine kinase
MNNEEKSFEERLNKEYDLRGRAKLAIYISMILYPSFLLLDWVYTPQFFRLFLIIRLVVVALHLVLLVLYTRTKTNRGYINLGMAMVIFDAAGIALMIQVMGGFYTSYYQGLNIIVMGMVVVIPLAFREAIILYALTWASYTIPSFINISRRGDPAISLGNEWRFVINNLFFLTSIIVVGAFGSYIMDSIRRRELRSRIRLEETSAKLQESNIKLKTLDELKTQFFANVNHELRTPLTLMLAPLGPMLEEQMGRISAEQRDTIETIRRNGYRLLKLINNLLDLSKLEEGKMRLKLKTVEFIEYTGSFLSTIKPLSDRKDIKLYFQHPPHRLDMTLDPDQFEKVSMNLLSNAVKFTPQGGRITVYIEEKDDMVLLIVEDTGEGIPKDMLKTIFDRFSQVDGSLSRSHEGTGIGLSLAKEIVHLHNGKIHAESELGRGSRFVVEVLKGDAHFSEDVLDRRTADQPVSIKKRFTDMEQPRVQDIVTNFRELQLADLDKVEITTDLTDREKKHDFQLLVIDDNTEVLKLMKLLLSGEFDLEFSTSAQQGLKLMRDQSPDLVLCDVMMPGMDGHAFCRQVKGDDTLKHTPVILVTARSGVEMLAEGIESGADDYIAKPFNATELKARIRSLLRIRRVEADLALANRNLRMRTSDLVERQRSLFIAMVKSLVSALEAKDIYTRHHSTRVTEFTLKIAKRMRLSERELEDLELASLLHDVGKIAVPEWVLNKKGKLTDEEFAYIKEHPVRGESILNPVIELNQISKIVRSHHERYDGRGYPDGLKGQEIPLGARIMSVADAYDAITSERPYRGAESHNYAMKEITKSSGTNFDPEVVQHFIEIAGEIVEDKAKKAEAGAPRPA